MSESRRSIGARAEARAREALLARGYRILGQNFTCRGGEIDFIAEQGGVLCFIEVRSVASTRFGLPQETVRRQKQERIARAAKRYLQGMRQPYPPCRFDVVGIYPAPDGEERIDMIENAFQTPR
jgi:putative endonuclease